MKAVVALVALFAVAIVGCGKSENTPVPVVPKGGPKVVETPKKMETPKAPGKIDPKTPPMIPPSKD